ncbi:MAG: hypothetical protein ABIJ97_07265 [Bacteroidota bacterium]
MKKIPVKCNLMLTDNLENMYSVGIGSITKYDKNGNEVATYSNSFLGEIHYADVTDPFRILLFYKEFGQILLLNKNLSEISDPINLDDLEIRQPGIACSSNQGGFWVYDLQNTNLSYFNRALEKMLVSFDVNALINQNEAPNFLIEKNDYLFLNFPKTGIVVFDRFGSFYKIIKLPNLRSFQINEKNIVFHENNSLFSYNSDKLATTAILLPDTMGVINARIEQNRIYIQKPENIKIYLYQLTD